MELTKDVKRTVARYVMEFARDEIFKKKQILLCSTFKHFVVKSVIIRGGSNISPGDSDHDKNFIKHYAGWLYDARRFC